MTSRMALLMMAGLGVAACQTGEAAEGTPSVQTVAVTRGDLSIRAEATGTVEPIREVEVKSKASGQILRLHADIGDEVEPGTLLAEIDPRDVRNRYDQTEADLAVAEARSEIARAQLDRSTQLLEADVITQQEHEGARLEDANALASLVKAKTNFELAELQMTDVRIRAPMAGTIIQKNVEEGVVIQSASQNVSGGTTLFVMANLSEMQVRTLVDETDVGELRDGMTTFVTVEAFPDRTFRGVVEKIEPQAVVEQNVTMFPVIVKLNNLSGLLRPGMNAEVEILIDEALDVLLVPNNAIVRTSDVGPAALALGLDVDELDLTQFMRGGRRGFGGGDSQGRGGRRPNGGEGEGGGAPAGAMSQAGASMHTGGADGGDGGDGGEGGEGASPSGAGGGQGDVMARMQELRAKVASGEITQDSMRAVLRGLRGAGAGGGGTFRRGGTDDGDATRAAPSRQSRPAVVFVMAEDSVPEPRLVQIGLGDWDNTQVVSGVEEGETLVVVGAAQLQAQQQEFLSRMRNRMGGGSPFGGAPRGGGRGR